MAVTVERTNTAVVIKLPLDTDPIDIQNALNYFRFVDIVSKSKATISDIDSLSKLVKSAWSPTVKDKLKAMDEFKDLFE